MEVENHLDIEKVAQRQIKELLTVARLQGQWTSAKSLHHQAIALKTEGPILNQFKVHIERVEKRLRVLGADSEIHIPNPVKEHKTHG